MSIKGIHYYVVLIMMSITISLIDFDIALSADRFVVSIPPEKIIETLKEHDRISEYTIEISAGRVYSVMKIPQDWVIKIKDHESPQVEAFASHGAGFLPANAIKKGTFNDFLVIESKPSDWGLLNIKANFTIDVFMKEEAKHILIEKKDMIITPVKE